MKRAGLGIALVWLLFGSASMASASPQGPWILPGTDIFITTGSASDPQFAIGPDGTTTVVTDLDNGIDNVIQVKDRPPGGSFGAATQVSPSGEDSYDPQVSIGADGTTAVAWEGSDGTDGLPQAAIRPPGGSFGPSIDLALPGEPVAEVEVAVGPDGTAIVVWKRFDGSDDRIQAAIRPPGGVFGPPVDLSGAGESAFEPEIAFAPDGSASAIWRREGILSSRIQVATRPPGGAFGAGVSISEAAGNVFQPDLGIAEDGTTFASWTRFNGSHTIVQAAVRPPGGSFGTAVDLSATGANTVDPLLAVTPGGEATVVWGRTDGINDRIQSSTRPPGGSFSAAVNISPAGTDSEDPQPAASPDGTVTVTWTRDDVVNRIEAVTRPPGGSFGAIAELAASGSNLSDSQIATSPDGSATAIWKVDDFPFPIQFASTAQPSLLLQVNRTGSGSGAVSSVPAGIDCGIDCAENLPSFTDVTLTATPEAGSSFTGWSGGGCTGTGACQVQMLEAATVSAEFTADPPPPVAKPRFGTMTVSPKKKGIKRGKKFTFKVRIKNAGGSAAKNLKICPKGPRGKVAFPSCRKRSSLGAGKTWLANFKVTVRGKARKRSKAKVTFTAFATGVTRKARATTITVK